MKNKNIQQTSFWEFLKNHKIEIPVIQRDYAQGRIGKEKLREKFLADLKAALDGRLNGDESQLKLDFVYGCNDNNNLNPLDGQQRLTTLWLLHWYIAYKAGKLKENISIFKRFSYETRASSLDFCEKLSNFHTKSDEKIIPLIQQQTWFFSAWKQDPTIQAMLNMLGGTSIKDGEQKEIIDGVEEIFQNCEESKYIEYWGTLINDDCPIIFYYLDLQGLKLSDDLYIKMNARGKPLTSFENFKADLVGYIKDKEWEKDKDIQETIAHKLDTDWTEIFWSNKSPENNIDEIYFAFVNRFILNTLITANDSSFNYKYKQEDIEQIDLFKHIYSGAARKYNNFKIYKQDESFDVAIERLEITLDNFYNFFEPKSIEDIKSMFSPSWTDGSKFYFIPEYVKEKDSENYTITSITQPQRVVFYAICCYFERGEYEEISFTQWMRVVWNIVENAYIESPVAISGAIRLIDELADYSRSLYPTLANSSFSIKSDFAKNQLIEEQEKARLIIKDQIFENNNEWENTIIEAEKLLFFKGKINYLLKASEYDFERFKQILTLCKEKLTIDNLMVLKDYLTYIDKETLPIPCKISSYENWKEILTNKQAEQAVVAFLKNSMQKQAYNENWDDWKKVLISDFDEINPLNFTIRNYYTNGWWGYNENDVFVYVNANISAAKLLSSNRKMIIERLIEQNVIQSTFPLYPNSNDHGQLLIYQNSFTESFTSQLSHLDRIHLFLSKNTFELKLWNNDRWESIVIDPYSTPNLFATLIDDIKEILIT